MAGRYGNDQLNAALLVLGLALIVIEMLTGWSWMSMFILALLICATSVCSPAISRRAMQKIKFLRWWGPVSNRLRNARLRFADRKTHRYFKCPQCKRTCVYRADAAKSISPVRIAIPSLSVKAEA